MSITADSHLNPPVPAVPSQVLAYTHHNDPTSRNDSRKEVFDTHELQAIPTHVSERTLDLSTISRASSAGLIVSKNAILVQQRHISRTLASDLILDIGTSEEDKKFKRIRLIHFATCCFSIWLEGWNDASTGPLLPRFQSHYHARIFCVSTPFIL